MSDDRFTGGDVDALNERLIEFSAGLPPNQRRVLGGIFEAARDGLDTVGYDEEGPASQLLTRINWEDLINPTGMGTSSLPHANLERE